MDATCPQRILADPLDRCLEHLEIASSPQERNEGATQQPAPWSFDTEFEGRQPRAVRRSNSKRKRGRHSTQKFETRPMRAEPRTRQTLLQESATREAPVKQVSMRDETKRHQPPHQSAPVAATDLGHLGASMSSRSSDVPAPEAPACSTCPSSTTDTKRHYQDPEHKSTR